MNELLANLLKQGEEAQKEETTSVTAPAASDLAFPLQRTHADPASGLVRLHNFTNAMAATTDAGKKQQLLLDVIDLLAETLRLEESNIGVDWRDANPAEFDTAVLGQGMQLVAMRINEYAPQVLVSLLTSPCNYITALDDETDTRHLGYVIAAAAQVIASHQLERNHTPATRKKRQKSRVSAGIFDTPKAEGGDDIFGSLMAALDGPAEAGDLPAQENNALLANLQNGNSDADQSEQDTSGHGAQTADTIDVGDSTIDGAESNRGSDDLASVLNSLGSSPRLRTVPDDDGDEDGDDEDGSALDAFLSNNASD